MSCSDLAQIIFCTFLKWSAVIKAAVCADTEQKTHTQTHTHTRKHTQTHAQTWGEDSRLRPQVGSRLSHVFNRSVGEHTWQPTKHCGASCDLTTTLSNMTLRVVLSWCSSPVFMMSWWRLVPPPLVQLTCHYDITVMSGSASCSSHDDINDVTFLFSLLC